MQVRVYATLRDLVGAKAVEVEVAQPVDVAGLLHQVGEAHPALAAKLWDERGALSSSIQVLVNGRSIQFLQGVHTLVRPTDSISLFPPVGGG